MTTTTARDHHAAITAEVRLGAVAELLKTYPQVTYLEESHTCEGWMSRRPRSCRNPARWRFRARRNQGRHRESRTGTYCWAHLWTQLYTNVEGPRFEKWWNERTAKTPSDR